MATMQKEYLKLYKHYSDHYGPNTCVFLMVGKFYEMYDSIDPVSGEGKTSMKRAVEILNIQVTLRKATDGSKDETILAGVPEQSLHKFASVLTKNNWTVVVCDQLKNVSGKVTERPVARILSPGTHTEAVGLDAPYVAAIWLEERNWQKGEAPAYGVAFFDLTTGHTSGFQGVASGTADVWSTDLLVHAIQVQNPRELIVLWRGDAMSRPSEAVLRSRFGGTTALLHCRSANPADQGGFETPLVREEFLTRLFSPETMLPIRDYLRISDAPSTERALISLLRFIEDHLPSSLENLQAFEPWTPKGRVHLGNNALTQLNCTSMRTDDSVLGLFQKTLTPPGRRQLRDRLLTPISDIAILEDRLNKVEFMIRFSEIPKLERYLRQISDFPRIHRKIQNYTITSEEVLALYETYTRMKDLAVLFQGTLFELSADNLAAFLELFDLFQQLFDIPKAHLAAETPDDLCFFKDQHAPKTAAVEQQLATIRADVKQRAEELAVWAGLPIDALRVESGRDTQVYSITGTKTTLTLLKKIASQKPAALEASEKQVAVSARLKKGALTIDPRAATGACPFPDMEVNIRKTTQGTIDCAYLEGVHGKVIGLRGQLATAAREELPPLCNTLIEETGTLLWNFLETWISEIDMSLCIAKVSQEYGFQKPSFLDAETFASVHVEGLRHPLIETACQRQAYVQHTVTLGTAEASAGWLVYGMNASGKSSLMKALGIAVILAQCGSYVPATKMVIRPFRSILTRILNQDNLWAGLSSFAVEMSELRDILLRADPFSLVLGDELCSGTESVSATALVASGIQTLLGKGARFVFATHLHGLMDLDCVADQPKLGVWHLKVKYDAVRDILIYDRSLHKGSGSSLYGIEVARALHLPTDFLETAQKIRRQLTGTAKEEETTGSQWNSQIHRRVCELCQHPIVRDLEVHHIRPRMEAQGKLFTDGSKRDAAQNLVVVCSTCHDKHHAGQLDIQPLQQTSAGLKRISDTESVFTASTTASKWSDEQRDVIVSTLQKNPNHPLKRIAFILEQDHEIVISEASLRNFRKRGADL